MPLLLAAASQPAAAQTGTHSCPATVTAQYEKVAAYPSDGARGSIQGFTPQLSPAGPLRLIMAQLAIAHGGEAVPSELLPPDELAYVVGRPMRWTLWDGRPPEPIGIVHLVCEYEGGLVLHRALGQRVRQCSLASAAVASPARARGKAEPKTEPAPAAGLRPLIARAVFSCR
ncbi:MAG: hypothetical protein JNJ71_05100 [Rubrivivax sp.]|nr:hypothetical protein [Rubrivivax sp.]